jgi:hypothetical protein
MIGRKICYCRNLAKNVHRNGFPGVRGNGIANELARGGPVLGFLGPEQTLGDPSREIKKGFVVGWSTSIGQDGEYLATPKDRLEN